MTVGGPFETCPNLRRLSYKGYISIRAESLLPIKAVPTMTPIMQYVLAPDGEIVKVSEVGYEYTGMYIPQG